MIKDIIKFFMFDPWAIPLLYAGMISSWAYVRYAFLGVHAKAWGFSVFAAIFPVLWMFHPASRFLGGAAAVICVLGATMAIIWDNYKEVVEWFMEPIVPKLAKWFERKPIDPETNDAFNRGYF